MPYSIFEKISIVFGMLIIMYSSYQLSDAFFSQYDVNHEPEKIVHTIDLPEYESKPYKSFDIAYDANEALCMQLNIFHEARNQSEQGMKAIALVTMNRVVDANYPNTVCKVVHQPNQFSWVGNVGPPNLKHPIERYAWDRAERIADLAISGQLDNFLPGVTLYHASHVNPKWGRNSSETLEIAQIEDHIFFYE